MSGGSWDYVYIKFDDVASNLMDSECPQRKKLGRLVDKVAAAMKAIEWNDSGDGADEEAAIRDVFDFLKQGTTPTEAE